MLAKQINHPEINLMFIPDYIEVALKANGCSLFDIKDLFYVKDLIIQDREMKSKYVNNKTTFPSVEGSNAKLQRRLSTNDMKDLISVNLICYKNILNNLYGLDDVIHVLTILYNYPLLEDKLPSISDEYKRELLMSLRGNNINISMNNNIADNELLEAHTIDNTIFIILHRGFFSYKNFRLSDLRELLLNRLMFSLFNGFSEERVASSKLFRALFKSL